MTGRLLGLRDVARALGCSPATVKRRIRDGELPAFRDGRIVRVRDVDLDRYVAARVASPAGAGESAPPTGRKLAAGKKLWD